MRTFGGSFTENFYSLKRERVLHIRNGEVSRAQLGSPAAVRETLKLRNADIWRNLAVIVGIPYLKRKLDESYDIHAAPRAALGSAAGGPRYHPDDSLPPHPTIKQRIIHYYKWFLRNVYPSVNAAYYFSILAFNLAYLFDNTKYSSPFLWLIKTRIRRLGSADYKAIALATLSPSSSTSSAPGGGGRRPGTGGALSFLRPQNIYTHLLGSLRILLPTSIFALKFLEWWHASDFSRQLARKATEAIDLPAPVVQGMTTHANPISEGKKDDNNTSAGEIPEKQANVSRDKPTRNPPISSTTYLPIFTVPARYGDENKDEKANQERGRDLCPICLNALTNPTACQTGYVYCYSCIFRWLNGEHERQLGFMSGEGTGAWEDDGDHSDSERKNEDEKSEFGNGHRQARSREGRWESGKGRCAVTGRRVLGGTEGLRRVLI